MPGKEEPGDYNGDEMCNHCFVPEMLINHISSHMRMGHESLEPSSFFLDGAILLVDISGFTKLSGSFCALGKDGIHVDELQLATNGYMGRLVDIIYSFGGDIIKFAGDAIICLFTSKLITHVSADTASNGQKKTKKKKRRSMEMSAEMQEFVGLGSTSRENMKNSLNHIRGRSNTNREEEYGEEELANDEKSVSDPISVLRAMHCAHQLKDVQTEKLTVHIGISCGEICFGVLGGYENRWECLISGTCIKQLSDCLDDAKSKEVVITSECNRALELYQRTMMMLKDGGLTREGETYGEITVLENGEKKQIRAEYEFTVNRLLESDNFRVSDIRLVTNHAQEPPPQPLIEREAVLPPDLPLKNVDTQDISIHTTTTTAMSPHHGLTSSDKRSVIEDSSLSSDAVAAAQESQQESLKLESQVSELVSQFVPPPAATTFIVSSTSARDLASLTTTATGSGNSHSHDTHINYTGEIREVTTMFMKWDSYDSNRKHRDLLVLQDCFYQTQKILHSTGAFLRQFLVDDKGCVLIACWGVPSMSYLDNAERALSSAAQIRDTLRKLSMHCSFGITTGDVYCGTVGSDVRMEYAAIGNVVNMAARLMGKAQGGVLIDVTTHSLLPAGMIPLVEAIAPIKVKGRDLPIQVYRYIAQGSILIDKRVVEDHEVRVVCKKTFIDLLESMTSSQKHHFSSEYLDNKSLDAAATTGGSSSRKVTEYATRLFSSFGGPTGAGAGRGGEGRALFGAQNAAIPVVLLEGMKGAGRTSIIRWLKKQAIDR